MNTPSRLPFAIRRWTPWLLAAAGVAIPLVSSLAPSERARALGASVEVDIGDLPPGGLATVEWRGKPVWILRRTPDMLAALPGLDPALADPTSLKDQQPAYARNPAQPGFIAREIAKSGVARAR